MHWARASGILLHPTSLPGRYGIGDLGNAAHNWIDFLASSQQTLWQVLPLGPTGYADSPYACLSAFAGNPQLISLDKLSAEGFLVAADLEDVPAFPPHRVDYGRVIAFKTPLLERAATQFLSRASRQQKRLYKQFAIRNRNWLDDYALFAAAKERHNQSIWYDWDPGIALRKPAAVANWQAKAADRIAVHKVLQFFFFQQWRALKQYANDRGVRIIGDMPIFVATDSADVWAHRDLFFLDELGRPTRVSGVPPDYFSETGQRWGNPLYRWDVMAEQGYQWWISRTLAALQQFDMIRIDHFRGFAAYWEIPATEPTAVNGRWVPGPGADFFRTIRRRLGDLAIIAEDLGVITPEVTDLLQQFGFPGMKILQFAFDQDALRASFDVTSPGWRNPFLPHNYVPNCIAYTGTHDNETTLGWLHSATPAQKKAALEYLGCTEPDFVQTMIRTVLASVANTAILPLQDILELGNEARMNHPGTVGSNWTWRFGQGALTPQLANRLAELTVLYERKEHKQ
jgi:4-alpha-glucanotransferase